MSIFVVVYAYDADVVVSQEDREAHIRFLSGLADQGRLLMSGPFDDERRGGMQIVQADAHEEVRDLLAHDPYVARGVVKSMDVRRWRPVLGQLAAHVPVATDEARWATETGESKLGSKR